MSFISIIVNYVNSYYSCPFMSIHVILVMHVSFDFSGNSLMLGREVPKIISVLKRHKLPDFCINLFLFA
jgi:hypothetical protein